MRAEPPPAGSEVQPSSEGDVGECGTLRCFALTSTGMLAMRQQVVLAAIDAPTAVRRLRRRSAAWLAIYIAAATAVLGIVATLIVRHEDGLLQLVLDYLVPKDWQFAARSLIRRVLDQQEKAVLINAALGASLLVVQILLFPIKEMVSAAIEEEGDLVGEPFDEHPLWFEAWEEIKLFVFVLTMQATIFWIGYSDDPVRGRVALVLSYVVLFASVGIDFLSPVLQRHKLRYSQMIKSFAAHPVLLFGFGAVFALPSIIAARIAVTHPSWTLSTQIAFSFGVQILGVALAAVGGTVAGAPLVADAKRRGRVAWPVRAVAWIVMLGLLGWNVYRFGTVGRSLHHKSQLLKCDYKIDTASLHADTPSAFDLVTGIKRDKITITAGFDVTVTNPTSVDVEIENNRLELRQRGQLIAQAQLPRGKVPAHSVQRLAVTVPLSIAPSQALRIRQLWTTKDWALTLYLEVADGFEFPIYILTAD